MIISDTLITFKFFSQKMIFSTKMPDSQPFKIISNNPNSIGKNTKKINTKHLKNCQQTTTSCHKSGQFVHKKGVPERKITLARLLQS